jgi:hypothetical protein
MSDRFGPFMRRERSASSRFARIAQGLVRAGSTSILVLLAGSLAGSGCSGWDAGGISPEEARRLVTAKNYESEALRCEDAHGASQGWACSRDCVTTCHSDTAIKVCTCEAGVFVSCPCLPPEGWPHPEGVEAPWCDALSSLPEALSGSACPAADLECLSDQVPGQGCRCMPNPNPTAPPLWVCGDTATLMLADDAPACEAYANGMPDRVEKIQECEPWAMCVARDWNEESTSPRGCACVPRPAGSQNFEWVCSGSNRWFRPAE